MFSLNKLTMFVGFMDIGDETWLTIETTDRFLNPVVIISLPDISGDTVF